MTLYVSNVDISTEARRATVADVLASLPHVHTCQECGGEGYGSYVVEGWAGRDVAYPVCPSCSGSGVVPSPEAVEAAAHVIWNDEAIWDGNAESQEDYLVRARAALGEFLRLQAEGEKE